MSEEKKRLLGGADEEPPPAYTGLPPKGPLSEQEQDEKPQNKVLLFLYEHRSSIPGYGMIRMVRGVSVYALYVLVAMLLAYLLNQLDRYTLPIVTTSAGYDLQYGDLLCMKNRKIPQNIFDDYNITSNITDICTKEKYFDEELNTTINVKKNETYCTTLPILLFGNETESENGTNITIHYNACEFNHSGKGLLYQIVAGPVFNNLYPLAGIFTGFLADYGYRTIWLVISLVFWSAITGVTGFSQAYWHLVLLRALLAIGAAGCSPFAVSIIGDYFPQEFRGTAIGVYYWGVYIGYSLAFAIGNGIQQALNWRWVFFLSAFIGIGAAIIILITVREPKRKKNPITDNPSEAKLPFLKRVVLLLRTFFMPGMFILCIAGGIRNAGGYVWGYNTEIFFEQFYTKDQINHFMSWIPLVGGSLGAMVGGIISDILVKGRSPYMRIWVLIISQILAAPFAAGALFLPYPWCFLILILSNVIGEMWIGVTSAIIVDLAPSKIRTGAMGVYLFIITVIGGNFNLLVDPLQKAFYKTTGSTITSSRWALFITFPCMYALSSILFVLAFIFMRLDIKRKEKLDQMLTLNDDGRKDEKASESDEEDGTPKDKAGHLETSYSGSEND